MRQPALIVFSGLPGTGKTTVARELARTLGAVCLRIDSIEQALRNAGRTVEIEGYAAAYAIAEDNTRVGNCVVADCVNPLEITRSEWRAVARRSGVPIFDVEIVCSDPVEHRHRVETRSADIAGHRLPTWDDVVAREYQPWDRERLVIDTSRHDVSECVQTILSRLGSDD